MTCSHKHSCGCGSLSNANIKAVIEGLLTTALDEKEFDVLELRNSIQQNLVKIGDVQVKLNDFKADMALNLAGTVKASDLANAKTELQNLITTQQNIYEDLQRSFEALTNQKLLNYQSAVQDIQQDVSEQLNTVQNQLASLVPTRDAYKIAVQNGFVGSEASWLDSLKGHSAYELAKAHGFKGSESEWVNSLKGNTGPQGPVGPKGTPGIDGRDGVDGTDGKDGTNGISAYEIARKNGYVGSEGFWLKSLIGEKGDRGVGLAHVSHNSDDTLTFLFTDNTSYTTRSLKGDQGIQGVKGDNTYQIAKNLGFIGTEKQWLESLGADTEVMTNLYEDAESVSSFVSGDEETTVTTRLGTEYPTVNKIIADSQSVLESALQELIQNSGIAERFKTLAELQASDLPDDSYALVADDSDMLNGVYIKESGTWVKSKYTTQTTNDSVGSLKYPLEPIQIEGERTGHYNDTGFGYTESNVYVESKKIPVSKGDCFLLVDSNTWEVASVVNLYDSSEEFVGTLAVKNFESELTPALKTKLRLGIYSSEKAFDNSGVVIPRDGFVTFGYKRETTLSTLNPESLKVYKTNFEGVFDNITKPMSLENMMLLDGSFESILVDKDFGTVGFDLSSKDGLFKIASTNLVSIQYPIKKGQYLNFMGFRGRSNAFSFAFVDAEDNSLGMYDLVDDTSLAIENEIQFVKNFKSPVDGFIRVQSQRLSTGSSFISITDTPIQFEEEYLKSGAHIDFMEGSISVSATISASDYRHSSFHTVALSTELTGVLTRSRSYVLKKGDVLEYELDATIDPRLALCFSKGQVLENSKALLNTDISSLLIAPEVFSLDMGIGYLKNPEENPYYVGNARSGKVAFSNEYEDTVVVFLRPDKSSELFNTFNCSEEYKVNVYSKEDYIKKRDAELKERLKIKSKLATDGNGFNHSLSYNDEISNLRISYPSVFLFRGEVLNCLVGSLSTVKTFRLRNPNKEEGVAELRNRGTVYMTSQGNGLAALPITKDDKYSYTPTQVLARENCVVHLAFMGLEPDLETLLDKENVLDHVNFTPRIVKQEDISIGVNMFPTLKIGVRSHIDPTNTPRFMQESKIPHNNPYNTLVSFVGKNSFVEYSNTVYALPPPLLALYAETDGGTSLSSTTRLMPENTSYRRLNEDIGLKNSGGSMGGRLMQNTLGTFIENNGVVHLPYAVGNRESAKFSSLDDYDPAVVNLDIMTLTGTESLADSASKSILRDLHKNYLKSISKEEYERQFKPTEDTYIHIPDVRGVYFNLCTVPSPLDDKWRTICQIKRGKDILAVTRAETAIQGQSSRGSARKSIDLSFRNDDFKKISVKFGDFPPENKYVLKSYFSTDRGMFKDNLTMDVWYAMRMTPAYPIGSVLPHSVFEDTQNYANLNARGTPYGFPTEVHVGGQFFSLSSIRIKKPEENYGMDADNRSHILIQPEVSPAGPNKWGTSAITNYEVRNPDMEDAGYSATDPNLPIEYADVQNDVQRFLDWGNGVTTGTIDARETYKDFIDLTSFIDYILTVELASHWDSIINNFLAGTHDRRIWRVYAYDADQSWGTTGSLYPQSPTSSYLGSGNLFKKLRDVFSDECDARYAQLRRKKVIDIDSLQKRIMDYGIKVNPESRKLEEKYWGVIPYAASPQYVMEWAFDRILMMDRMFKYSSDNVLFQGVVNIKALAPEEVYTYTVTDLGLTSDEKYWVWVTTPYDEIEITHELNSEGNLSINFKNISEEDFDPSAQLINVFKGDTYDL